jgi:thiol-disulfide isomerase/thioredoxin
MINYLTSSFLYTKLANLVLWFYSDTKLGIAYGVIFVLCAMLLPEPTYEGPENVVYFRTPNSLDEEMDRDKRVVWVVAFYTTWNPACVSFAPIFASISNEYRLDNLKFGKVDIGRLPDIGKKYHVSDSSLSRQLPTVILFKNGKEKLVKFFFSEDNTKAAFDLNNIYKECKENPIKSAKATKSDEKNKKTD